MLQKWLTDSITKYLAEFNKKIQKWFNFNWQLFSLADLRIILLAMIRTENTKLRKNTTIPFLFFIFSLCIFFYRFHSAYFKFTVISSEITLVLNSLTHTQMEKTPLFGPDIHSGIRGQRPWISQYFLIICVFPDKIVVGRGDRIGNWVTANYDGSSLT